MFAAEIRRLALMLLLAFACVVFAAAYWALFARESMLGRGDNPRLAIAASQIVRGNVYDQDGNLLATTRIERDGNVRTYPQTAIYGGLGYLSPTYGAGGFEALYDELLRGTESPSADAVEAVFGPLTSTRQVGNDIRLTLIDQVQMQAMQGLQSHTGALVVMVVPSGDLLAIVNSPTFDPATLEAEWEALRNHPDNPLFNRALDGRYPPGSASESVLLSAMLLEATSLDIVFENATSPVTLGDADETASVLSCAVRLPQTDLTLRDAYAFACPAPFAQYTEAANQAVVQGALDTFAELVRAARLDRATVELSGAAFAQGNIMANALGQGELQVSPLAMAMLGAAIVNDGNAPLPDLLDATRAPGQAEWSETTGLPQTVPFTTTTTARRLADLMRFTVANGAAQNAGRPNIDIGGHAATAVSASGEPLTWFIGFATLGGQQAVSIAIVLENTDDPGLAADIAGDVLIAVQEALGPASP
jgi:peptidoglycan glycosyltransferase